MMFEREVRYQVIKLKTGKPVECVVVEKDWPEYEIVWQMIQDRMEGRPNKIERLQKELAALKRPKVKHEPHCMKLDIYDERDWGCTCGAEEAALKKGEDSFDEEQAKIGGMPYGTYGGY